VPGVGDAEDLGDGALAVDHQPVHLAEDVADLAEVVLGRQPGSGDQPVVVGAALAVDQHELDRWAGGELAEEVSNEHGLAEPGQAADDHAGDLSGADEDRAAVLGPPKPPRGQGGGLDAGQINPGRRQQRVAMQATEPDQTRSLLLGAHRDTAPGVSQIGRGPLVVGQAGTGDGGHGGGDALVVSDELGRGEAVRAGPLVSVAEAESLR